MVAVTTVLQSGPPGPAPSCSGSPGEGLDRGARLVGALGEGTAGDGVWGSEMSAQLGKSHKACSLDSPMSRFPDLG